MAAPGTAIQPLACDTAIQPLACDTAAPYERRRPEETTLYQVVQDHIETFFAQVEQETGTGLPQFVKDEFEAFLECGMLAHGFLRLRWAECARDTLMNKAILTTLNFDMLNQGFILKNPLFQSLTEPIKINNLSIHSLRLWLAWG